MSAKAWDYLTLRGKRIYAKKFFRSKPYSSKYQFGNNWKAARSLGYGGEGVACLWVQVGGPNNLIRDRMAVKELKLSTAGYKDPDRYYEDPPGAGPNSRVPREAFTQQMSTPARPTAHTPAMATHREHIVRLRTWTRNVVRKSWRLYLDFCDYGSLYELILLHQRAVPAAPFSEAFLYYVFESLAIAAEDMARAPGLDPARNDPPGTQAIHQDIKPDNIFLSKPSVYRWAPYPEVKVGDFGGGRMVHPTQPITANPNSYTDDTATPGYLPPELYFVNGVQPFTQTTSGLTSPQRVNSAVNVWQIGRVMLDMMRLRCSDPMDQITYSSIARDDTLVYGRGTDPWVPPVRDQDCAQHYSPGLKDLVHRCMDVKPGNRITPTTLRTACANVINANYAHLRNRAYGNYLVGPTNRLRIPMHGLDRIFRRGVAFVDPGELTL